MNMSRAASPSRFRSFCPLSIRCEYFPLSFPYFILRCQRLREQRIRACTCTMYMLQRNEIKEKETKLHGVYKLVIERRGDENTLESEYLHVYTSTPHY